MFTLAAGVPTRVFPLAGVPSNRTRAFTPRSVAPRGVPATASGAHPASPAAVAHHDLPAKVYIEHTDAYQVVYHANYFNFLRRGREAALFGHRARDDDDHHHSADAPLAPDLLPPSCATVLVVAVDDVVFARSATLGDDLIVRTRLLGAGERTLTLRQEVLHAADETLMLAATVVVAPADAAGAPLGVGVGARDAARDPADDPADDPAWLARSNGVCVYSDSHVDSESLIPRDASPSATAEVTLFESELSLGTGATDADVLRWFERGRTDAIGGADALAELKENGIVVVVSKMNRGRFAPAVAGGGAPGWHPDERRARAETDDVRASSSSESSADARGGGVRFGGERMGRALVRSTVELRRRGLQVVFVQRLLARGRDGEGWVTAATAEVTCTCLARDSGRPTPCPPGLAERFAKIAAREEVKVKTK